jgi:hypothetical protein
MTLFTFRGAKSHEWTFCDPIKIDIIQHPGSNQGRKVGARENEEWRMENI